MQFDKEEISDVEDRRREDVNVETLVGGDMSSRNRQPSSNTAGSPTVSETASVGELQKNELSIEVLQSRDTAGLVESEYNVIGDGDGGGVSPSPNSSLANSNSPILRSSSARGGSGEEVGGHHQLNNGSHWAKKAHEFFGYTALPTAVIIGIFFFALFIKARIEAHTVGRIIAGYCAVMSIVMTSLLIYCHLASYTSPVIQRKIIRILIMVPVYAVDSFLALWNHEFAPVVGILRDMYESYVIYTFFHLLMDYLGGEAVVFQGRLRRIKYMAPLCCFGEFQLTPSVFQRWKLMLVQYMILKPLIGAAAVYLLMSDRYDESYWGWDGAHLWVVLLLNVSVTLAFTSLVYLFLEFKIDLVAHNPMGKFAAVKAVVFLTFWQSVVLGILVHYEWISGSKEGLWSKDEVSTGVQDFLICIEMLAMCYVHHKVFPETPFLGPTGMHGTLKMWAIKHAFSVKDVVLDTIDTAVPNVVVSGVGTVVAVPGALATSVVTGVSTVATGVKKVISPTVPPHSRGHEA